MSESPLEKLIRLTLVVVPTHPRVNPKSGKREMVDEYHYDRKSGKAPDAPGRRRAHKAAGTATTAGKATRAPSATTTVRKAAVKAAPKPKAPAKAKKPKEPKYSKEETRTWLDRHPVAAANIVDLYDQSTDAEKKTGKEWYPNAHKIAGQMAKTWDVSPRTAAGMIATYSPQTAWGRNLIEADEVLRTRTPVGGKGAHLSIVKTPDELQERRFGIMATENNRNRAQALLEGVDFEDAFAGPRNKDGSLPPNSLKVRAFGELIDRGGQDPDKALPDVVVDRHAAGAARGVRFTEDDYGIDGPSSSMKKYEVYANAYRDAAAELSKREGRTIPPEEVQATTWLTRQRLNMDEVANRRKLGVRDSRESLNYFASYEPTVADIIDDPMVGYAEIHPDPKVQKLAKDIKDRVRETSRLDIADLKLDDLGIRASKLSDGILAKAAAAEPEITESLSKIADDSGGRLDQLEFRLKTGESLQRKLVSKSLAKKVSVEDYAAKVGDALRYTLVDKPGSNMDTGQKALDALQAKGHKVVSVENSWGEGGEYYGVNIQMEAPNGIQWELQLHTADSLDRKWTSHYWYGISRNESLPADVRADAAAKSAASWLGLEKPKDWDGLGKQMFDPSDKTTHVGGKGPAKMPDHVKIPQPADDPELKQIIAAPGRPPLEASGTVDDPIAVGNDLDAAVIYLSQGAHVRLDQPDEVTVLMDKLKSYVAEVKAKGDKAPDINLCLVTVQGSNLFCHDSKGIPRIKMPQLSGTPETGSPAAKLLKEGKPTVDVTQEFRAALEAMGVKVTRKNVPANHLRATQSELSGDKVGGLAGAIKAGKVPPAGIFVTRDGYVIDGHHRWAANVVIDSDDNKLGDITMPVDEVDLDIGTAIDFANQFTAKIGIKPQTMADSPAQQVNLKKVLDAAEDAPAGTVRTWDGQKYKKGTDGEWTIVKASAASGWLGGCPGCGPMPRQEDMIALSQIVQAHKRRGDSGTPVSDLRTAIRAAADTRAKRDVMIQARRLGREDLIPDVWTTEVAASSSQQEWDEVMATVPTPLSRMASRLL